MEYKLLDNVKRGFITTREPELVNDELMITFTGAPSGATAIFENENGNSFYRLLKDETCALPKEFIKGTLTATVVVLNGQTDATKYHCEVIYSKSVCGILVVCPNGIDVPQEIISIYTHIQELKDKHASLVKEIGDLNEKLVRLLDGWDVV